MPLLSGMQWICHNGVFVPARQPVLTASNRGFKYGDGLFETAAFYNGKLLLGANHFERLFSGMQLLHMLLHFTSEQLTESIGELCERNGCSASARVRIAVYREEDNSASYVIEAATLKDKIRWNEQGWRLMIYPFARKSCDAFSNLKTANYLPYLMAAQYAKDNNADECLVLNQYDRICDGSKTNLFLLKETEVCTPALSEGCVAGVMRCAVIDFLKSSGYTVRQEAVTKEDLLRAGHVFVTNAITGMRWVRHFEGKEYDYGLLKNLCNELLETIYAR